MGTSPTPCSQVVCSKFQEYKWLVERVRRYSTHFLEYLVTHFLVISHHVHEDLKILQKTMKQLQFANVHHLKDSWCIFSQMNFSWISFFRHFHTMIWHFFGVNCRGESASPTSKMRHILLQLLCSPSFDISRFADTCTIFPEFFFHESALFHISKNDFAFSWLTFSGESASPHQQQKCAIFL